MAVESKKTEAEKNLEFAKKKDAVKVKGVFNFFEVPGGKLEFPFKKYKNDPVVSYSFVDGEIYEIPMAVAKHLCSDCWYPNYSYKEDEKGRPVSRVTSKVKRCGFQSLEFLDIEGITSASEPVSSVEIVKD